MLGTSQQRGSGSATREPAKLSKNVEAFHLQLKIEAAHGVSSRTVSNFRHLQFGPRLFRLPFVVTSPRSAGVLSCVQLFFFFCLRGAGFTARQPWCFMTGILIFLLPQPSCALSVPAVLTLISAGSVDCINLRYFCSRGGSRSRRSARFCL